MCTEIFEGVIKIFRQPKIYREGGGDTEGGKIENVRFFAVFITLFLPKRGSNFCPSCMSLVVCMFVCMYVCLFSSLAFVYNLWFVDY